MEKPPKERRYNNERFARGSGEEAFLEGLQSGHVTQCSQGSGPRGQERAASFHSETGAEGFELGSAPLHCTTQGMEGMWDSSWVQSPPPTSHTLQCISPPLKTL